MRWLPILIIVFLVGCSGSGNKTAEKDESGVFPAGYKDQILFTIPKILDDPTNIKDGFITDPFLVKSGNSSIYAVCLRGNPRDLGRNYMGNKELVAYFYGGTITQLISAPPDVCSKAAFKPFPELEKICRAERCA